ncbi:hypothetical protein COT44_02870 [Candidatus Shapirobacteria bacterium CG08_land_8_20_14_0_20_39_18]|uniref:Uncharacterized protein n=1 Tax=Candidatus Shapirobacteria bacterium CG08_land_8_20_14_0_20_39_18 TaxID=1974883 RepID=A0A2M6XCZ2_9BACT|nr:MAG: hypothetical protein COT44_02870 [Candidatus Shapirobacteria bacterium CG08_land_8_20_14_0_20_39_18]PIY65623.1 MAG: hypothetical protein COY91_01980 [Candidatus Shapirobacteria bacterium CG_4_10_14_0_8_um_filter_39_15]PJE68097.1 MAG: hypothetical protein COU94_03760 [Candidatus Shapirobacteria bacterium CG10_big_fil_rev_8_21_14_0_10_38_8]
MLKKELKSHLLVTFTWLWLISLFRFNLHQSWQTQLPTFLFFWLGSFVGTMLPDLDQFIYVLVSHPEDYNSLRVKRVWDQGNIKETLVLLADTSGERIKLVFHNVLFQAVLVILCFFVLSSTSNIFGKGLVMAMFLHLLKDEIELLRSGNQEFLKKLLFWPIKTEISNDNQKYFIYGSAFIFILFSLFLI